MNILAIEDNKIDRLVFTKAIRRSYPDCELTFAKSLTEAINILSQNNFDLIVTDLRLPDAEELETIEAIRALTGNPILIISGSYSLKILEKALDGGSARYIRKGESWVKQLGFVINSLITECQLLKAVGDYKG